MPYHTVKIKIHVPSGAVFDAEVFHDTKLRDLILDFREFLGNHGDVVVNVQKIGTAHPEYSSSLDPNATIDQLGIKDGDSLLFITKSKQKADEGSPDLVDDSIIAELVQKDKLHIRLPLPEKLTVHEYAGQLMDFLNPSDTIYSVFSILGTQNSEALTQLRELVAHKDPAAISPKFLYPIVQNAGGIPLQIAKLHYGSPLIVDFEGIWKPLEFLRDVIKDLKWRAKHEEEMAKLERQKMLAELIDKYLEQADKINKLKLPAETREQLLMLMLPRVTSLDTVVLSSVIHERRTRRHDSKFLGH